MAIPRNEELFFLFDFRSFGKMGERKNLVFGFMEIKMLIKVNGEIVKEGRKGQSEV